MIETVRVATIVVFVLLGLFFTLVSTTGVIRLPDVYSRAHTASQADTLGAGFTVAAVALSLGWGAPTVKAILLLAFIFITNPTAAHAIARSADEVGLEPWTVEDERTDRQIHRDAQNDEGPTVADGGERQ